MNDPRMKIQYDFDSDEVDNGKDKSGYARPIRDDDNEKHYGFGFNYEDDEVFPLFVDGLEVWEFFRRREAKLRRQSERED